MTLPDDQYYHSLLARYIKGDLSNDEADALFGFLKARPEDADRLLKDPALIDYVKLASKGKQPDEPASQRMEARLLQAMQQAKGEKQVAKVRKLPLWWAAASIILVLAGGAYLWLSKSLSTEVLVEKSAAPPAADIAPGGNSAILTLADGTEVRLDSAQNGNIARQGNVKVLKLSNGQLAYRAGNSAAASEMVLFNTMRTPRGGQYKLRLPDGTDVWLNSASSITFPTAFTGDERVIRITGEVYFEVAPDPDKPFIVSRGQTSIRVLGTHFNVEAYDDEQWMKVTLLEGKVKVAGKTPGQALTLVPGQQARVAGNGNIALAESVSLEEVMAWKNGMFSYKGADIETIMRQVARWYDVEVIIEEPVHEKFYADVSRNTKISTLLRMLEATKTVSFRIEGRTVRVMAGAH